MSPDKSLQNLFNAALERSDATERARFLDEACGADAALRERVEKLLRAQEEVGAFMAQPSRKPAGLDLNPTARVVIPLTEKPGDLIGRYKLLQQIGEGGCGVVYMAEQEEPVRRRVALKVIKLGMDTKQVIARFEAERQALALMDHPNIAKIFDAGVTGVPVAAGILPAVEPGVPPGGTGSDDSKRVESSVAGPGGKMPPSTAGETPAATLSAGRPYFVMELVRGTKITEFCDQKELPTQERLDLFLQVCSAVQHAHQKGIIHRDIKPSNILVTVIDGVPVPKVIDFGIAKATNNQPLTDKTVFTAFEQFIGTPAYMSPEQAELSGVDIDTRTDIYSLGVVLYELLTGAPPFDQKELLAAGLDEMRRIIRETEPPRPSNRLSTMAAAALTTTAHHRHTEPPRLIHSVRGDLDWIAMKCLEKDRARRYETANALAMDIRRHLDCEPVVARPPSRWYEFQKSVRRHKFGFAAAAAVIGVLVVGIIGTTYGFLRAEQARRAEAGRAEGERQAKERAEANFTLATKAVEKYLGTVTDDPELKRADLNRLRKKLLESAIPFYQKLTTQQSEDPEIEASRGRGYYRLALVRRALGEDEAGVEDLEAARAIFVPLTTDFPAVPAYRRDLAMSLTSLGHTLNHLGKHKEAGAAYREAKGILEKLAADFATEPEYRNTLVNNHNNLGNLLFDIGKHAEAETIYRQAIAIGTKLVTDFPNVPAYRSELAGSYLNLGSSLDDLGKGEDAEAALRQALGIQTKLVTDEPDEPENRQSLAMTQTNLGALLNRLGKKPEAESLYQKNIVLWGNLAADFPSVPEYRRLLAGDYLNLGNTLDELGSREEAGAAFRKAVAIQEQLVAEFPNVPAYRRELAGSYNGLGLLLNKLGRRSEAETAYRQTLAIQEKLSADYANVPQYAADLGGGYCNFGHWIRAGGQPERALDWFQRAIVLLEPIVAKAPRLVEARQSLVYCHAGRAMAFDELGRRAEAIPDWEHALELDEGGYKEVYRLRICRNRKDVAGCLAAAAAFEASKPTNPNVMYDAASNRAVCATAISENPSTSATDSARLAREQADLAMAWLHKAAAAGYKNARQVMADKELEVLHHREDFQKLVAMMETGAAAK